MAGQTAALGAAIARNAEAALDVAHGVIDHLSDLKDRFERSRGRIELVAQNTDPQTTRPTSAPGPGL